MKKKSLNITIISDLNSWLNDFIPSFIKKLIQNRHRINWVHNMSEVGHGDISFLLGCSQLMTEKVMLKNKNNLVVHESALPKGRGWSPMTWQILEGQNNIPITLFEVGKDIDSGLIYLIEEIEFVGHELIDEIRCQQADYTFKLCMDFISKYPEILKLSKVQEGEPSYYKKRNKKDSRIDPHKTIAEQFNLFRVVDNLRYPAFFTFNEQDYKITIEKVVK